MSGPKNVTVGGSLAGDIYDEDGNLLLGTGLDAQTGGLGAGIRRYTDAGIYNGDFSLPPPAPTSTITPDNPLPFWTWVVVSGTSVIANPIIDPAAASGRRIVMRMTTGAASDEAYLEQIVPVNGSAGQSYVYIPHATVRTDSLVNSIQVYCKAQYLTVDGITTGTESVNSPTTTSIGASTTRDIFVYPDGHGIVPANAYYLRVRFGMVRGAAATTDTVVVHWTEVRKQWGQKNLIAPEGTTPASYGHLNIYQDAGVMHIDANTAGAAGLQPDIELDGVTGEIRLNTAAGSAAQVKFGTSGSLFANNSGYFDMYEITAPSGGFADSGRLFLRDNGSGKTQLCIIFSTGAIQVIATQP